MKYLLHTNDLKIQDIVDPVEHATPDMKTALQIAGEWCNCSPASILEGDLITHDSMPGARFFAYQSGTAVSVLCQLPDNFNYVFSIETFGHGKHKHDVFFHKRGSELPENYIDQDLIDRQLDSMRVKQEA